MSEEGDEVEEGDEKESLFKSKHYFDLGGAVDDVNTSLDAKDKALAAAKLAGKSLFNVGLFAGKLGVNVLKHASKEAPHALARMAQDELKNNPDLTDEQRERYEGAVAKSKELRRQEAQEELQRREEEERAKRL